MIKRIKDRCRRWYGGLNWWQLTLLVSIFYATIGILFEFVFSGSLSLDHVYLRCALGLLSGIIGGPLIIFIRKDKEKWEREQEKKKLENRS